MTRSISRAAALASTLAFGFAASVASSPAQAGFLEQLFGGGAPVSAPAPAQAPSYSYEPDQPFFPSRRSDSGSHKLSSREPHRAARELHRAVRHVERRNPQRVAAAHPVTPRVDPSDKQQPTDLMHDKTLRAGDAVMMADGIHVYGGPETAKHTESQFKALSDARYVSKTDRVALAAVDMKGDIERGAPRDNIVASGRSVVEVKPVTQGFKITDSRGQEVRYVGP